MLTITFEIDGRRVSLDNLEDALERAILTAAEDKIRSKLTELRDPETGEFPVVTIHGRSLDNLSVKVSGSEKLIARVKARLGVDDGTREQPEDNRMETTPHAFLCHASEDKEIARPLAEELRRNGVDTFYDEWEIGPGDSIRQKIDEGIGDCTHFIVLLTPISIEKPWVKAEIDAGFGRNLKGECKFIPLRCGLEVDRLPSLLEAKLSPAIDGSHDKSNIKKLIDFIHGIGVSPPLGEPPQAIQESSGGALGLSPAAEAIVKITIEDSENGMADSQMISLRQLKEATGLEDDDIIDAVDELESRGYVRVISTQSIDPLDGEHVWAEASLFTTFDKYFKPWNPEDDALRIANALENGKSGDLPEMAQEYSWPPRRMNPAVSYLIENGLVGASDELGSLPWVRWSIYKTPGTRRFVRDRS